MKRTPLRRKAKLRTRRPMRKRRATPRRRGEYEDRPYIDWLKLRPCRAPGHNHPADDAHHLRHDERGASLGAHIKDDGRAISLCRPAHGDIEVGHGPWADWTRAQTKAWENEQAAIQRAEYLAAKTREDAQ